jgi:hypothetical protein
LARKTDMTGMTLPTAAALAQTAAPVAAKGRVQVDLLPGELSSPSAERNKENHWRSRLPACLISTLLHTILLVVLALFSLHHPGNDGVAILARLGAQSTTVTLEAINKQDAPLNQQTALAPQPVTINLAPSITTMASPRRQPAVAVELDAGAVFSLGGAPAESSPLIRLPGGGLSGRTAEGRVELGRRYGATATSEQAVEEGLRWLADHQRADGSWSFDLQLDPCGGRCRHSKKKDSTTPSTAATGLALLAFLGAGHTHLDGPYADTVRRGIYFLRSEAMEVEAGYDLQRGSMYGQGIALMALSEALAMTAEGKPHESDLYELVSRAAWFTVIAQHDSGSWGYVPGSPGDTTVTGWQVLSLVAAKRSDAPLGTYTLRNAKHFLLSTSEPRDYSFGYQGPPGEPTTTAIGLTLMLYLGESPAYTPFYDALTELAERGPTLTNVYHDYYGTLALHHSRHPSWDLWNTKLRDFLVAKQATSGHERGSWHFRDKWGDVGGRLYTTAMCTMILEVYYRYLPLYAEIEEFPL